jgi:hypothetical protein
MAQSYREDCNDAKAARRGLVEQRPVSTKSKKKAKPVLLEYRRDRDNKFLRVLKWDRDWHRFNTYRTVEEAEKVMADQLRKHPGLWEFRVVPPVN